MFTALKGERAQSFPAESAELKAAFDAPVADATFTLDDGSTTRVRFGRSGEKTYAMREDKDGAATAEVTSNGPGAVDRNLNDLKDKSVLSIDKDKVARVVFKTADGKEIAIER